jgi:Flp pilus assembly pilin Flp
MFRKFLRDERGVTAIEYCFMAATIGLTVIIMMPNFQNQIMMQYSNLASHIASGK